MAIGLNVTLRNSRANEIDDLANLGGAGAFINVYSGVRPATGGAAGTLLVQLQMSLVAFGAAANGVITAAAVTPGIAGNGGEATWFRITDSNTNFVLDGDVGTSGSDLNLSVIDITVGASVSISSLVITEGNA